MKSCGYYWISQSNNENHSWALLRMSQHLLLGDLSQVIIFKFCFITWSIGMKVSLHTCECMKHMGNPYVDAVNPRVTQSVLVMCTQTETQWKLFLLIYRHHPAKNSLKSHSGREQSSIIWSKLLFQEWAGGVWLTSCPRLRLLARK